MVIADSPIGAALLTVKVIVPVDAVELGLIVAVTPFGNPVALNVTL